MRLPLPVRFLAFSACLCALFFCGAEASALDSFPVDDMWGRRVELLQSPDGATIYLAVEAPSMEAQIKAFDTSSLTWSSETLTAPGTGSTYRRWGEQGYAVDRDGNIHVAWSERDFVDRTLECSDLAEDAAGVRIKHVMYDAASGSWTSEQVIAERFFGDSNCFFHKLDMAADSTGRLLVVFLTGVPEGSPGQAAYLLFDGSAWLESADLADWKIDPHAGGSAISPWIYAGHTDRVDRAIRAHVEVFAAGASFPTETRVFPLADDPTRDRVATSPMAFAGAGDEIHLVWFDSCDSISSPGTWYTCAVSYAARMGGEWQPMVEIAGPGLLTDTGNDTGAFPAVAATSLGIRAVVIATRGRLYAALAEGSGGWSLPELLELEKPVVEVSEAVLQPLSVHPAGDHVFLLVWVSEDTEIRYALYEPELICPGETLCEGECVDTDSNALHCGTCGHACLATEACEAGACINAETQPDVPEESAADADQSETMLPDPDAADASGEDGGTEAGGVEGGCGCLMAA